VREASQRAFAGQQVPHQAQIGNRQHGPRKTIREIDLKASFGPRPLTDGGGPLRLFREKHGTGREHASALSSRLIGCLDAPSKSSALRLTTGMG